MKTKQKYWYITDIKECVLCGHQEKVRYRVYEKPEYSINWEQKACGEHFM